MWSSRWECWLAMGAMRLTNTELMRETYSLDELGPSLLNIYLASKKPLEECWIGYVKRPVFGLQSGLFLLI